MLQGDHSGIEASSLGDPPSCRSHRALPLTASEGAREGTGLRGGGWGFHAPGPEVADTHRPSFDNTG